EELSLTPVRDTTLQLTRSGEVMFTNLPEWPIHEIFDRERQWLGCRLLDRLQKRETADEEIPPRLPRGGAGAGSAAWEWEEDAVDNAFFNTVPLDLSKDFFPFGELPRFGDVFYLNCDVFSKPQAKIILKIKLTNPASAGESAPIPPVSKKGQLKIQWEYSDGQRWVTLECKDGTEAFTKDGEVSFLVPSPFLHATVNGLEGFWIRARLVSGSYGDPPCIQSITVTSSLTVGPERPEVIVTNNNFVFEEVAGTASFQPFRLASNPHRALYLGFKVPNGGQNA